MLVYLLLSAAIGGGSYLGGKAYRAGNMPMFWTAMTVLTAGVGVDAAGVGEIKDAGRTPTGFAGSAWNPMREL